MTTAKCINNLGYPASLKWHKNYVVIPDEEAERDGHLHVVDESGEDSLFPKECFEIVDAPPPKPLSREDCMRFLEKWSTRSAGKAYRSREAGREDIAHRCEGYADGLNDAWHLLGGTILGKDFPEEDHEELEQLMNGHWGDIKGDFPEDEREVTERDSDV